MIDSRASGLDYHIRPSRPGMSTQEGAIRQDRRTGLPQQDLFKRVLDAMPYPEYLIRAHDLTIVWENSVSRQGPVPRSRKCYSRIHGLTKPCSQKGRLCLLEEAMALKRFVLLEQNGEGGRYFEYQGFPIFDPEGGVAYLLETRVDISKRKRAEAALYESEQKYRMLFQEADAAIFLIDTDSGYVVNANKQAERLLGLTLEQLTVMHQVEFLSPQMLEHMETEFADNSKPGHEVDAQIVRRDGLVIPVSVTSNALTIHGRKLVQRVFKDRTEHRKAEARLMRYQRQLRSLASQLSLAQERERRRIAAQVHDSIGQTLAVCKMKLDGLAESLASTSVANEVREVDSLIGQTIEETRALAYGISSPLLYEVGLEAAVEKLAEEMSERSGLQISFVHGEPLSIDSDLSITVFQALRELIINAVKHSKARHIQIQLHGRGRALVAVVADDGVGFDTSKSSPGRRTKGFGLFSIREGLASVGGCLTVKSRHGIGSRIELTVPIRREQERGSGR
jgi:PAS domain S-box-containing protein